MKYLIFFFLMKALLIAIFGYMRFGHVPAIYITSAAFVVAAICLTFANPKTES